MSATPTLRRTAGLVAAFAAVAVATITLTTVILATPANADSQIKVTLSGLPSTLTDGRAGRLSIKIENNSKTVVVARRVIQINLPGLAPDGVRVVPTQGFLGLVESSNGNDQVTFAEASGQAIESHRATSRTFAIEFTNAPGGRATITGAAVGPGGQVLDSASAQVMINSNGVGPTPTQPRPSVTRTRTSTPSPTVAPSTVAATFPPLPAAGPTVSVDPLAGDVGTTPLSGDGGGVPTILYVLGAILVVIGGGILWLLFRGGRREPAEFDPAPAYAGHPGGPSTPPPWGPTSSRVPTSDQGRHGSPPWTAAEGRPSLGYPQAAPTPTTVMPTVSSERTAPIPRPVVDPHTPPPVDPWATSGGPA